MSLKFKRFLKLWAGLAIACIGVFFMFLYIGRLIEWAMQFAWVYRWAFVLTGFIYLVITGVMAWVLNGFIEDSN